MGTKYKTHPIAEVVLFVIALAGLHAGNSYADEDNKYLKAVREFADNVLKYGKDVYGPKHTSLFMDINATDERGGAWQRLADMPKGVEQHGFEALNGSLYIVCGGGGDPIVHRRDVYAYDISTDTWTAKASAPIAVQSPILRTANGKLYLVGGLNNHDGTMALKYNTTFEYDPATDTWTRKANMPTPREDMASAVVNGKIYVFGGILGPAPYMNITFAVEAYDPVSDIWEIKSNMPHPMCLGDFGCTYNGKIYLVSGADTLREYRSHLFPTNRVYEYDPSSETWERKADIPTGRCYKEVEEADGLLYVISGATTSTVKNTFKTEVYSISNDRWTAGPDAPYAARGTGLAKYDGKIYMSGGYYYGRHVRSLYRFDPNAVDIRWPQPAEPVTQDSLLHKAAFTGDIGQIQTCIADGADINGRDDIGRTALHWAVNEGHENVVALLLAENANVNARDDTDNIPLHWAVMRRTNKEIVALLIARGSDVEARDEAGHTPLHKAVLAGHRDIVESLLLKGAKVNTRKYDYRPSPLHLAWKPDIAELLIVHRAAVNKGDWNGNTAMHLAALAGLQDLAELLLAKGANAEIRNKHAETPLHLAAKGGNDDMVRFLLAKGLDVSARQENDWTSLHNAVRYGHQGTVTLLLAHGADVDSKDNQGRTPLWWARNRGHEEIVDLLRKHGAKE